jgi:large subunit ribosomal protein L24
VLAAGPLPIPNAEAAINVAAGQARFSNVVLGTAKADLEATANVDLATVTLDALLTLSGRPASAGGARPAVLVAIKGPLSAPRRAVDTGLLASWLTLRAVEQQSQQIDAMEKAGRERRFPPASRARPTPPPAEPDVTSSTRSEELSVEPASPADGPARQPPAAPRAESAPPLAPPAPARTVVRPPGLLGAQN